MEAIISDKIRMNLVLLLVVVVLETSPATGGQTFAEFERISESLTEDSKGRLTRLRACNDITMVQCRPCEVMRIVNASCATSRTRETSSMQRCSDVSFQLEFDHLYPVSNHHLEEITEHCNGYQSCELDLKNHTKNCVSAGYSSCCLEIYYICTQKTESILFLADDASGNVNNVSFQCPTSDQSIDSIVMAFNSSRVVNHEAGECYKQSLNTNSLKRRCDRGGCSGVFVSGTRGCGQDKYVNNYGVYFCYTCKGSKMKNAIDAAESGDTKIEIQNLSENITMPPSTATIVNQGNLRYVYVASASAIAGLAVFLLLVVCCVVYAKRRRNGEAYARRLREIRRQEPLKSTPESNASEAEPKSYGYPEMTPRQNNIPEAFNPLCVYSRNYGDALKTVYEKLDQCDNELSPFYDELNLCVMDINSISTEK